MNERFMPLHMMYERYAPEEPTSAPVMMSRSLPNVKPAMAAAQQTSDQIISDATRMAEHRSSEIVAEAREKATDIRRQAEELNAENEELRRQLAEQKDPRVELAQAELVAGIAPEDPAAYSELVCSLF